MSRQITYRYNPDTDSYERIYPTLARRIISWSTYLLVGMFLGALLFFLVFFVFDSPTEANLRKENAQLRSQYNVMQRRLNSSLKVMEGIRQRDDNYYRVLMQLDPLSDTQRYAGLDNEERYQQLQKMPEKAMLTELSRGLDLLERELYIQSRSFDELRNAALNRQEQLRHVPGVLPVNKDTYKIASGFGYRNDPFNSTKKFHSGVDFEGKVGEAVLATADGTVEEANWQSGLGYSILIDHGHNYKTLYSHLDKMTVTKGQRITRRQKIGEMGSTGKSRTPHLHYEVHFKGEAQNPVNYWFIDMDEPKEISLQSGNAGKVMD